MKGDYSGTSPGEESSEGLQAKQQMALTASVLLGFGPGRNCFGGADPEGSPGTQSPQVRLAEAPAPSPSPWLSQPPACVFQHAGRSENCCLPSHPFLLFPSFFLSLPFFLFCFTTSKPMQTWRIRLSDLPKALLPERGSLGPLELSRKT